MHTSLKGGMAMHISYIKQHDLCNILKWHFHPCVEKYIFSACMRSISQSDVSFIQASYICSNSDFTPFMKYYNNPHTVLSTGHEHRHNNDSAYTPTSCREALLVHASRTSFSILKSCCSIYLYI